MKNPLRIAFRPLLLMLWFIFIVGLSVDAQDLSDLYGTYQGKMKCKIEWAKDKNDQELTGVVINEITLTISPPNNISINYHIQGERSEPTKENDFYNGYSDWKGKFSGTINKDLSYNCSGYMEDDFEGGTAKSNPTRDYSTATGKISNDRIEGKLKYYWEFELPLKKQNQHCDCEITVPKDLKPGMPFSVNVETNGCATGKPLILYEGSEKPIQKWDGKSVKVEVILNCCDKSTSEKTFIVPGYGGCDCEIELPDNLKPGSDFYVKINQIGCISSYPIIYYNGSDKPIPKWDGKAVNVEVMANCCDQTIVDKTFSVPAYGSGQQITVTTQNPGPLPLPTPGQFFGGSAAALLVTTLLQTLFSGGGNNTVPPIPPEETTPKDPKPKEPTPKEPLPKDPLPKDPLPKDPLPKDPLPKDPLPKDPLPKDPLPKDPLPKDPLPKDPKPKEPLPKDPLPKDPLPKDPLPKDTLPKDSLPKDPSPLDKAEKLKQMEVKQDELRKQAIQENISVGSYFTLVKNLFQTVPASVIEVKDTAVSAVKTTATVVKTTGEFAKELYDNPAERKRLTTNLDITMSHFKTSATKYLESGKWNEDLNQIHEMNNKFVNDMWNDPVDTSKKFITTAFGGHFYHNAFDPNKSLGERLLNLGVGYGKTIFTLGTIQGGGVGTMLWDHHVNLISQKLAPYIPGFLDDVKDNVIFEAIKVKANNLYFTHVNPKPENTTMVHNLNNFFETTVNPGYDNTIH